MHSTLSFEMMHLPQGEGADYSLHFKGLFDDGIVQETARFARGVRTEIVTFRFFNVRQNIPTGT